MSPLLEIQLFGHPELRLDGQTPDLKLPHKALALLYYLALTAQPVGRETLATLLWPDAPMPTAKQALRNVLSLLRKVLGDVLAITYRTIALQAAPIHHIDVLAFQQGVSAVQKAQQQGTVPDLALWQATLTLYRGDFLAGFYIHQSELFEEWTTQQREYLRNQLITNLLALSDAYAANAILAAALTCLNRLLEIEPHNEAAYSRQIQLLFRLGRRTEALQSYERYRQMLAKEFNMPPSPALIALIAELRMQADNVATPVPQIQSLATTQTSAAAAPVQLLTLSSSLDQTASQQTLPTNLMRPLSAFVGRSQEFVYISQRITTADCRLLTIVGPGGMGKTSLALAVGQQLLRTQPTTFPDGIFFVPLSDVEAINADHDKRLPLTDSALGEAILRAIAEQIGYKLDAGVSCALQLQAYLRTQQILLILDNFEQLLAGLDGVVALLTQVPQLKMLITSRARLNVRGESVLTLNNLSLPPLAYQAAIAATQANAAYVIPAAVWQASEAVVMFVQRAQQFDPTFTINAETIGPVGQICQLVEGLPLGIELATSMLPLFSCTALAAALSRSLDFLATDLRDLPAGQRTLAAVFARSWQLLPVEGQQLLARLSIFPGSFERAAAERITGATGVLLRRLLDQSLLSNVGDSRYALHRTVQAFAQQKLQQWPEQRATLHEHYAHFYLECLARLGQAQSEAAYVTITAQLQADLEHVRTAWRWSVDQSNLALMELSVDSLQELYLTTGIYVEAIQLLEAALPIIRHAVATSPTATQPQQLLARLLCYLAQFYRLYPSLCEVGKLDTWVQEALMLGQALADPALQGLAYHELARQAQVRQDFAAMRRCAEYACDYARLANLPQLLAESLNDLGIARSINSHPLAGIKHFHAAQEALRQRPYRTLSVRIVSNLGLFYLGGHAYQAATRYLQPHTVQPIFEDWVHVGNLLMMLGAYTEAQQEYAHGLTMAQIRHLPYWESWLHAGSARLHRVCGDPAAAQSACALALQMALATGNYFVEQVVHIYWGDALADLGDLRAAERHYQQAIALEKGQNWCFRATDAYAGLAVLRLAQNDLMGAVTNAEAALTRLAQHGLAAAREPFMVYWNCVRVLKAAGDPRARTVLIAAYQFLQEIAQQLEDERLQHSFLAHVAVNRNLVAAAQAAAIMPAPIIQSRLPDR